MEKFEIMQARHSVRKYVNRPIEPDKVSKLNAAIEEINRSTGLQLQLVTEEPEAFDANKAHYGMFSGCRNYFALVGPKGREEEIGYYGEALVLLAQELGLNTCWVALTYKKGKARFETAPGNKLYLVIALGYGENQGVPHRNKPLTSLCNIGSDSPAWFKDGMEAVLLAPTAVNQQKFYFTCTGNTVSAKAKFGFNNIIDLGIAKYHFELGAGKENFKWSEK